MPFPLTLCKDLAATRANLVPAAVQLDLVFRSAGKRAHWEPPLSLGYMSRTRTFADVVDSELAPPEATEAAATNIGEIAVAATLFVAAKVFARVAPPALIQLRQELKL